MAIQQAISNLATLTAGAVSINKKLKLDQKQTPVTSDKVSASDVNKKLLEKMAKEDAEKILAQKKAKAERKQEALDIATETDLRKIGVAPESSRAFVLNRRLGVQMGSQALRDLKGNVVATYSEMAERLADKSLKDTLTSQAKSSSRYRERLLSLGHNYDERVKNAVLASGVK